MTTPHPSEFTTDLYVPRYAPHHSGDWQLQVGGFVVVPGYWSGPQSVPAMVALIRGETMWMSLTPVEIESQEIGVRASTGHVLIHGMGLGWAAAACAIRDEVTRVTVVERDPHVLAIHREIDIFAQLPAAARAKLDIVEGDAYAYRPELHVDLLMPDIWQPLVSDGRVDEVRAMQDRAQADGVYFWGQELEIARHAVAAGRAIDDAGIAATIADFGLPLIGAELPGYADKTRRAAERWMRGRWLDRAGADTVAAS